MIALEYGDFGDEWKEVQLSLWGKGLAKGSFGVCVCVRVHVRQGGGLRIQSQCPEGERPKPSGRDRKSRILKKCDGGNQRHRVSGGRESPARVPGKPLV